MDTWIYVAGQLELFIWNIQKNGGSPKAIRITSKINGSEGYKNIGIFEPKELAT
jgi:hypothetical protein